MVNAHRHAFVRCPSTSSRPCSPIAFRSSLLLLHQSPQSIRCKSPQSASTVSPASGSYHGLASTRYLVIATGRSAHCRCTPPASYA